MTPYRQADNKYPWLSTRPFMGEELHFMMTNERSDSWYSGNMEEAHWHYLSLISKGSRVIDCGANEGMTALVAAIKAGDAGEVLALEPAPHNWEPLNINIALNGMRKRIHPQPWAVAAVPGRMKFHGEIAGGEDSEVEGMTLNNLAWFRPDIIKLDVEGYEVKALIGAGDLLRDRKPVVFLEAHLSEDGVDMRRFGTTPQDLMDLLAVVDYEMFSCGGQRLTLASEIPHGAVVLRPKGGKPWPAHLIYTLAYGPEAWRHATVMVPSLRRFGKFAGEIKVFTDQEGGIDGAEILRWPCEVEHPYMGKAYIGQFLDTEPYSKVMFLDSDVVAIRDINPMFHHGGISMPVECVIDDVYQNWYSIASVAPYTPGERGFNAGTLVADACDWNQLCKRWLETCLDHLEEAKKCGMDQPALNHLFRTGEYKINPFPEDWVHFLHDASGPVTANTKLIHPKNPLKYQIMRCIYGIREHYQ